MARYRSRPAENERMKNGRGGWRSKVKRTGIPDLHFYPLIVDYDRAGAELDTDRRPAFDIEPIAHEAGEHCDKRYECVLLPPSIAYVQFLYGQKGADEQDYSFSGHLEAHQERRRLTTFRRPSRQLVQSNMAGKMRIREWCLEYEAGNKGVVEGRSNHLEDEVEVISVGHL
jgi:hypothetical protein